MGRPNSEKAGLAAIVLTSNKLGSSLEVVVGYHFTGQAILQARGPDGVQVSEIAAKVTLKRRPVEEAMMLLYPDRLLRGEYQVILEERARGRLVGQLLRQRPRGATVSHYSDTAGSPVWGVWDDLEEAKRIRGALGFGLDVAISAGFELYDLSDDPYYTPGQKLRRASLRGVINGSGGAVGVGLFTLACTSPLAPGCVIGSIIAGTIGSLAADSLFTEPFSKIFVGPKERRLQPHNP